MPTEQDSDHSHERLKILLTEGSSTSARQTLYALGGRHVIDVVDPTALGQCRFSRYVRRWYRCPSFSHEPLAYLKCLARRLRSESYDVLLPTHEQVYLLARVRDDVRRFAGLALPDFAAIHCMQDKAEFVRTMNELELPCPQTQIVRSRGELEKSPTLPCFIKLAHSTAGTGVYRVDDTDELRRVANELEKCGDLNDESEILVQQPASGTLSIVQTVFQRGRLVGAHCARATVTGVGGAPMARVSVWDESVVEDIRRLGKHLNWHGALFLEYFFDEASGRVQYLEANPRIGETLNATICGVNLCEQLLRVSLDEDVEPLPQGKAGVRSHQAFMIAMAGAMNGHCRRYLLRELRRVRHREGVFENSEDELTRLRQDWPSVIPATAVIGRLLLTPRSAKKIVRQTVANYSLPDASARVIRHLKQDELTSCFT